MKTYIFIDGTNLFRSAKRFDPNLVIDFDKFALWLTREVGANASFGAAYYYTGVHQNTSPIPSPAEDFLHNLELRKGYYIRRELVVPRDSTCKNCGIESTVFTEKCVDTRLTADVVYFAAMQAYDIGVIVSSDIDQLPAIEAATQLGRQMWIASLSLNGIAKDLRQKAFGTIMLQDGIRHFRRKHHAANAD